MEIGQSLKGKGYYIQACYDNYHHSLFLCGTDFHLMFMFPLTKYFILCRDKFDIATKTDKIMSVFMIALAVLSSVVAIYSDAYTLIRKNKPANA